MRAVLEPGVQFAAALTDAVLHIDLVALVARDREMESRHRPALERLLPFDWIEKIAVELRIAEQQPVAAVRAERGAFLHEAAEWRHAGARADHDDVARGILWQAEALVPFDK